MSNRPSPRLIDILICPGRGLYYVFVGVLLAAEEDRSTYPNVMLSQYIFYSSQLCIIFGVLYTSMVLTTKYLLDAALSCV